VSSVSREPARKHLADLLETALVGDGKPVDAVYPYQIGDFGNAFKVVTVTNGRTRRRVSSFSSEWDTRPSFDVHVFVLYADPDTGWTEADAEDALDEIEAIVAEVVRTNLSAPGYWNDMTYAEDIDTQADGVEIGGVEYRREIIPITMQIVC
jgi:hypothetical protein